LAKAFDVAEPRRVLRRWRHLGAPHGFLEAMTRQWTHQSRILCYAGHALRRKMSTPRALPQGDPLSLLGLITLLTPLHNEIAREYPRSRLYGYVDDRS
jgi:hypothetical protein